MGGRREAELHRMYAVKRYTHGRLRKKVHLLSSSLRDGGSQCRASNLSHPRTRLRIILFIAMESALFYRSSINVELCSPTYLEKSNILYWVSAV